MEAIEHAPALGQEYEVFTRLVVREDSMTLFGFSSLEERALFDQIIAVSGIGPKTGLGILSGLGAQLLREAIRSNDVRALTNIPNVGKKTAERLIIELRDKLLKEESAQAFSTLVAASDKSKVRTDALQALIALGYPRAVAEKAIRGVIQHDPANADNTESLIKAALKFALNG